jgi:hypothetical protein
VTNTPDLEEFGGHWGPTRSRRSGTQPAARRVCLVARPHHVAGEPIGQVIQRPVTSCTLDAVRNPDRLIARLETRPGSKRPRTKQRVHCPATTHSTHQQSDAEAIGADGSDCRSGLSRRRSGIRVPSLP